MEGKLELDESHNDKEYTVPLVEGKRINTARSHES